MIRFCCAAAFAAAFAAAPCLAAGEDAAPVRHSIVAKLDPTRGELEVTDVLTVRGRPALVFQFAAWLEIERVSIDGGSARATDAEGSWRLPLPDTGTHRVELRLRGRVPPLPPDDQRRTTPPAASSAEGSFLSTYSGWFPMTDDDWTAFRLAVEVPAPFRAVSSGRLEEEVLGETVNRAVFVADYPAEPPALFAGPYTIQEQDSDGVRIRTYFHAELAGLATDYLRASAGFLQRYQRLIGPYPYANFHIISSPLPVGMGFPNLTYVGRTVLPLPFMRGRSLAHEVLHNWWGNGVAIDYPTGNWAEGLTTYMADYALAEEEGSERAEEMRLAWLRDFAALPAGRDIPVTAFVGKRHDAGQVVGYNKVAFIFHMLRQELGDEVFYAGLREFWQQQRFRIAGWAELRRAFASAAGRDLSWFFEQWLERMGAPRLSLGDVAVSPEGDAFRVTLTARQDSPAYRLVVPVVIDTDAGPLRRQILLQNTETIAALVVEAAPSAVHLDPAHDLFRRLLPGETPTILRDVTLAEDALTFIAARSAADEQVARGLAERVMDTRVRFGSADAAELAPNPLLIVGITPQVEAFLARFELDAVPESLAGRGTARVWAARREGAAPLLVVAADDVAALEALLRPLPHYGSKSYLVFEGPRALETGTWPVQHSPLSRRFDR